ncbi:hypothetical protein MNBD_NITROSPINAE03-491 [hydrothermal vent metagenome]|uniref:Cytochrome c domain-containing protein n=1 Tax=hydrothermal vent metagenome TaxID=652676 RepID=A0A3B1BTB3_9ZZZZ
MKRSFNSLLALTFIFGLVSLIFPVKSEATPNFGREQGLACSKCHTSWPLLNDFGRAFLENGFTVDDVEKVPPSMTGQRAIPVPALRINLRMLDKRTSKDRTYSTLTEKDKQLKMRSGHEIEAFFADRVGEFYYFIEFEAEDEWSDPAGNAPGFQVQVPMAYAGWVFRREFSVRAGYMSPLSPDGRNTVSQQKVHRYGWSASGKGFVPGEAQAVSAYGNIGDAFYILSWHGQDGGLEGQDPQFFTGRLAYDLPFNVSIGGFYSSGKKYNGDIGKSEDKLDRYGVDLQYQSEGGFQLNALYAVKNEDSTTTDETSGASSLAGATDNNLSVYAQYIIAGAEKPMASIGANYDSFTMNDGDDDWTRGALFLTYFAKENVKVQLGWEGTLDSPERYKNKESRYTFVVDIGI